LTTVGLVCLLLPTPGQAQAGGGGPLSESEAEAMEMAMEMTFVCSPDRHGRMGATESVIRREAGDLTGTSSWVRSAEGTFLVLEGYDENLAGHCLILAWFGGEFEEGDYPIRQLSMAAMEEEVGSEEHSFFVMAAVRAPQESSVLVTESGSVEIASLAGGEVAGTFDLTGFVVEGGERTEGVVWEGDFSALEPED
jgi:hypothetical protein